MQIVTITTRTVDNELIPGVAINIFNLSSILVTSGVTDNSGVLTISLPEDTYNSYYYKQGISTTQPVQLVVSPSSKNFVIIVNKLRPNTTNNPDLITVYGFLNSIDGKPVDRNRLVFTPLLTTITVTSMILIDPIQVISDKNGWFDFTLIRGIKYLVKYDGYEDTLTVETANQQSVEISTLLFPLPVELTLTSTSIAISKSAGQNTDISYTIRYTDGTYKNFGTAWSDVLAEYSTSDIVELHYLAGKLLIVPLKPGTCIVTFNRKIKDGYYWKTPPAFTAPQLTITVTS